jgi:hypothetical protein
MDRRRNEEKGVKAVELYNAGFSMAKIAKMLGGTRQSIYDLLKRREGYKARHFIPKKEQYFNGVKYTLRSTGYFCATTGRRKLLHRDVWEFYNGLIPDKYDVHHIDHDKSNNKIENLELLPKSEHARLYATGHNQYTNKAAI